VTTFMIAAYGVSGTTVSEWLWAQKTARSYAAPKLASLPPTTERFLQNAKRAHFQVAAQVAKLYVQYFVPVELVSRA